MGAILGGVALAAVFFVLAFLFQEDDWISLSLAGLALVCLVGGFAVGCSDPSHFT